MTKIKNKFLLILASIVGLCCAFCAFLIRPRNSVVASAEMYNDVNGTNSKYYYVFNQSISFPGIDSLDEGFIMTVVGYDSNDAVVFSASGGITFIAQSFMSTYFYFNLKNNVAFIRTPFYTIASRSPLVHVIYCVSNPFNGNTTRYEMAPETVALLETASFNPYNNGYNSGLSAGYDSGYDEGLSAGYDSGYDEGYDSGKQAGQTLGYETGYNVGLDVGFGHGYELGRDEGFNAGYDSGHDDGHDLGWQEGMSYGYSEGLMDANRGLWSERLRFSWDNSWTDVTVYSDNHDVFNNGGIDFSKLKTLFEEACVLSGQSVPDVTSVPISVTVEINPSDLDFQILTNSPDLTSYDGYYTYEGSRFWGSFQSMDVAEEIQFYKFETYNSLSVIPDSFTFTFDETWDFVVYCWDKRIGYADYNLGYDHGYQSGHTIGMDEGKQVAQSKLDNAYNNGYAVGLSKAEKFDFAYAVSTVVGAPVQVVKEFLSFELLGVNMLAFFSGIFSLLIIVKVIKFFI